MTNREARIQSVIEKCHIVMANMSKADIQPLEREANYILVQALRVEAEALGLMDIPEVREVFQKRSTAGTHFRRYPQDFFDTDFDSPFAQ